MIRCIALCFSVLLGCSDDPTPAADAGAVDAARDSSSSPAPRPIRCTADELAANDLTGGGLLEIGFATGANPLQYTNRCATVKAGSSVTFRGSFRQHPLEPAGGDTPSPIPSLETDQPDNRLAVTMSAPGTYGFQCAFHPTLMYGAIRVVP